MQALVLTVPAGEAELAADALWALGVLAVEERSTGQGTEDQMVELWTSLGNELDGVSRAAEAFPARWRWRVVEVDDAVVDSWRAHAVASWITDSLVVTPAWITAPGVDRRVTVVRIEPGSAFGLGDHPTTVLALRLVSELLWPGATMLDVGCGTGVIAVAGALLGASYVEAIDISPAAIEATAANAAANGVEALVHAGRTPLAELDGEFDLVAANILAPALIELAPELRRVVGRSGLLVVSGMLDGAYDHVVDALRPMQEVQKATREGWVALVLRH